MQTLSPIFLQALGQIAPAPLTAAEQRLLAYKLALQRHDWSFEWSDDGVVHRAGRDEQRRLEAERAAIDPDGTVWNTLAPASHRFCAMRTAAYDKADPRRFTGDRLTGFGGLE